MKRLKFIITIFGPLLCGFIMGLLSGSEGYQTISKPPLSPPGIIFPIAWSILYLLMGISLYIVIKNNGKSKAKNFYIQLIINYIWPFLFFKLKKYILSTIWILLLLFFVINMIKDFIETKKIAGYLQFPYFIWLLFALYLNIGIAFLN